MYPGERLNGYSHLLGLLLALPAAAALLLKTVPTGDPARIAGALVFSLSAVALYAASTLFHSTRGRLKRVWERADHCAIYLLIAGSYTPMALVGLRGGWGWSLFAVAWTLAAAGTVFKLFFIDRFPRLSTATYIGMGWLAVVAIVPMVQRLPAATLVWMVAGGVTYTVGTVFYHSRRIRYAHAIWHLFVIGGSACHFAAVLTQMLPPRG